MSWFLRSGSDPQSDSAAFRDLPDTSVSPHANAVAPISPSTMTHHTQQGGGLIPQKQQQVIRSSATMVQQRTFHNGSALELPPRSLTPRGAANNNGMTSDDDFRRCSSYAGGSDTGSGFLVTTTGRSGFGIGVTNAAHRAMLVGSNDHQQHSAPTSHPATPRLEVKGPNILVVGQQHAGKSAFINTYRYAVTGHDAWAAAPVGRNVSRGTTTLEPYFPTSRPSGDVQFLLLDTAGRRLKGLSVDTDNDDTKLYDKILKGMPWKSALVDSKVEGGEQEEENCVPDNAVNHVIIVVNALDLVEDKGQAYLWWRYAVTLENVGYLGGLVMWFERKMSSVVPYVVITHMDSVGWRMEAQLKENLASVVHKNHIFCVANHPDDVTQTSEHTLQNLRKLHERVSTDLEATKATQARSVKHTTTTTTTPVVGK
eukprot:PhM_4_TR5347/c1_g1_i1/m.101527